MFLESTWSSKIHLPKSHVKRTQTLQELTLNSSFKRTEDERKEGDPAMHPHDLVVAWLPSSLCTHGCVPECVWSLCLLGKSVPNGETRNETDDTVWAEGTSPGRNFSTSSIHAIDTVQASHGCLRAWRTGRFSWAQLGDVAWGQAVPWPVPPYEKFAE